jgi:hypothetical protein
MVTLHTQAEQRKVCTPSLYSLSLSVSMCDTHPSLTSGNPNNSGPVACIDSVMMSPSCIMDDMPYQYKTWEKKRCQEPFPQVPGTGTEPNIGVQATAYSLRSYVAAASSRA